MPIAPFPPGGGPTPGTGPQLLVIPPNAILDPAPPTPILAGHAVALIDVVGTPTFVLCSSLTATGEPDQFIGFVGTPSIVPGATYIVSGRGSTVAPFVEGGGLLTPNSEVFLSLTPGEVTHVPPFGSGTTMLKLGYATSTTTMILTTDVRREIP